MNASIMGEKILEVLKVKNLCVVNIQDFFKLWYHETQGLKDNLFTRKLLDFSNTYNLDYVIVMGVDGKPNVVRFFKKPETKLIEAIDELQETSEETT